MSVKVKVLIGFCLGVLATFAIPLFLIAFGAINWSASAKPSRLETDLATVAFIKSMRVRAPKENNPVGADAAALSAGLNHYRENCVICHAAPGVESTELSMGLNPPAPPLEKPFVQKLSDGELFWITKHGIRMTGMPSFGMTHKDEEIWQIVSFLRHLPKLTDQEKQQLQPTVAEKEHHHAGAEQATPTSHEHSHNESHDSIPK